MESEIYRGARLENTPDGATTKDPQKDEKV